MRTPIRYLSVLLALMLAFQPALATEVEDEERALERQQEEENPAPNKASHVPVQAVDEDSQPTEEPPHPLPLLNRVVDPGTFATLHWTPDQSFGSIATPVPVLVAHGTKPGPQLCLTAAIHGDELNGIEMVRRLM